MAPHDPAKRYRAATLAERFRGRAAIIALRAELAAKPRSMFAAKVSDDLADARRPDDERLPRAS